MKWRRYAIVVLVAAALLAALPFGLQQLSFFRVRRVELVGVRFLDPHPFLAQLGLAADRNLFDDNDVLERRGAEIPGVAGVRAERVLPGTLRLVVTEDVPVALVPGPAGLVPLGADGQALPFDPLVGDLDVPIARRADTILVRTLAHIRATAGRLYGAVSAADRTGATVVLELGREQVLVEAAVPPETLRAIEVVRSHLADTKRPFTQIDARFEGWIVVRRSRA